MWEDEEDQEDRGISDIDFFHLLDTYHEHHTQSSDVGHGEFTNGTDAENGDGAEADLEGFIPYLEPQSRTDRGYAVAKAEDASQMRPAADGLNNSYARVVHTNGIHHLAMLTCLCHGEDDAVLDLVASQLLPASFTSIRTLFTTPLLDYFHLCNLELKASAYQFYQLICRLTRPLGNHKSVNLYHEF